MNLKRKPQYVDDGSKYLEMVPRMLAEALIAKYKLSKSVENGPMSSTDPYIVNGLYDQNRMDTDVPYPRRYIRLK